MSHSVLFYLLAIPLHFVLRVLFDTSNSKKVLKCTIIYSYELEVRHQLIKAFFIPGTPSVTKHETINGSVACHRGAFYLTTIKKCECKRWIRTDVSHRRRSLIVLHGFPKSDVSRREKSNIFTGISRYVSQIILTSTFNTR